MKVAVFWIGIIGVAGKGPNWMEDYDGEKTIGELTRKMEAAGLGSIGKRIRIIKHRPFSLDYDEKDPYWAENTKLSSFSSYYGGLRGQYLEMVYAIV